MIELPRPETVLDGLTLPECPRWHRGALYFSDMNMGRVYRLNAEDGAEVVAEFPGKHVGGIGFLPDDSLLVVLQDDRVIQRVHRGAATLYADLVPMTQFNLNDMIVVGDDAYVSQPGFDMRSSAPRGRIAPTQLLRVRADGSVAVAADAMASPNGIAASSDGRTLYVAEAAGLRVSRFGIDGEGRLADRRDHATLPQGSAPDGICLDSDGAVWAATPAAVSGPAKGLGVVRLSAEGRPTHVVPTDDRHALACVFGGEKRDWLYVCTVADIRGEGAFAAGAGRLERVRLDFEGSGIP